MLTDHRIFASLTLFMGFMTAAWSSNAFEAVPLLGVIGVVLGVSAVVAGVMALRRHPRREASAIEGRRSGGVVSLRAAAIFAGIEVVVIVLVSVLLGVFGHGDVIVPAVAFVVAAHFALFRLVQEQPLHVVAAVAGCCGAGLAIVLVLLGSIDEATGRAVAGLSLAACTAAYAAVFGRAALSRA